MNFLAANFVAHTHTHTHIQPKSTCSNENWATRTEPWTDGHESRTLARTLLSCSDSPASDFRRLAICLAHSFLEAKQSQARNKAKTLISALNAQQQQATWRTMLTSMSIDGPRVCYSTHTHPRPIPWLPLCSLEYLPSMKPSHCHWPKFGVVYTWELQYCGQRLSKTDHDIWLFRFFK